MTIIIVIQKLILKNQKISKQFKINKINFKTIEIYDDRYPMSKI